MILNDFDACQEALRRIDLSEAALPIYHGRILTENTDIYCKLQKLLACPDMESCHMWLYDLDVENLSESECQKVCNLYKLAIDRGCIADPEAQLADEQTTAADATPAVQSQPAEPKPAKPQPKLPMASYTVVYSAMRDGSIKTGEAYSNAISTRAAKADVLAKLDKAGYQNVTILAIEAGDPDYSNCQDETQAEEPAVEVGEADVREPLSHAFDPVGVKASTANTCGQDEVRMLLNEEDVKREIRKAFDEASAEIGDGGSDMNFATRFLQLHRKELDRLAEMLAKTDKQAKANLALICSKLTDGKIQLAESTGVRMLCCGLLKILLTIFKLMSLGIGFTGKTVEYVAKLLAAGADRCNAALGEDEEEKQISEADGDDEDGDGEDSDDSKSGEDPDDGEDEDSSDGDGSGDDAKDDDRGDKKEEDVVEPDEKMSSDGGEASDDDVPADDELSDREKSQLKDSYKKAFKATMAKCKFTGKSFDQLNLEQKTKFFTELSKAWGEKADPQKFMSQKETEALEQIVVKA